MIQTAAEYIPVPVPRHLVPDAFEWLAERTKGASGKARSQQPSAPNVLPSGWTAALIGKLYQESYSRMQALLKHLAANPGKWFATSELQKVMGEANPNSMPGHFGAFGRRINTYGVNVWPFDRRWNDEKGEMFYSMSADVADIIKRL